MKSKDFVTGGKGNISKIPSYPELKPLTFTDWHKLIYDCEWHPDFAHMYGYAIMTMEQYESWCEENKQKPIWNG